MRRTALILGSSLGIAACANPALDPGAQTARGAVECFWASSVTGFTEAGPGRTILNIGFQESWELTLSPGCSNVDWAMKIGIVSRGSQRICTDRPAELIVPSASGSSSQHCLVSNVRKLSSEEAAAARGETPR